MLRAVKVLYAETIEVATIRAHEEDFDFETNMCLRLE